MSYYPAFCGYKLISKATKAEMGNAGRGLYLDAGNRSKREGMDITLRGTEKQ